MTAAYIYDALRTPRGKGRKDGALHEVTSLRLSAVTLNALKERNNLDGHAVEDVIWGNVTQVMEQGGCLARSAVLASDLDESIPGLAINRFCASGMEAVNLAANQVRGGAGEGYIAGGVESMSRVPMASDGGAIAVDPSITFDQYFVPQGIGADIIATEYGFSRDQGDALAVLALGNLGKAIGNAALVVCRNALQATDRDRFVLDTIATTGRFAGPVAGPAENSREDVALPVDHVGIGVAPRRDQADVFGDRRMGRAGILAVDDLVEVVRIENVGGFHSTSFR